MPCLSYGLYGGAMCPQRGKKCHLNFYLRSCFLFIGGVSTKILRVDVLGSYRLEGTNSFKKITKIVGNINNRTDDQHEVPSIFVFRTDWKSFKFYQDSQLIWGGPLQPLYLGDHCMRQGSSRLAWSHHDTDDRPRPERKGNSPYP